MNIVKDKLVRSLDFLNSIWDAIKSLPSQIITQLKEAIKYMFVPSETYFSSKFDSLKTKLETKLSYSSYVSLVEGLRGSGGTFKDVRVTLYGSDIVLIPASIVNSQLDTIHSWVRGFIFILLIFYNINNIYKMIRGTSLISVTQTMNNRKGD